MSSNLPPPPPPPPSRRTGLPPNSTTSSSKKKAPAVPEPHSLQAELPVLESAPTSTNFSELVESAAQYGMQNLQSAMDTFSTAPETTGTRAMLPDTSSTPTSSPYKLPPPPPPARATVATHVPPPPPVHPLKQSQQKQSPVPPPPPVVSPTVVSSIPPPPTTTTTTTNKEPPPFRDPSIFHKSLGVTAPRQCKLPVFVLATEQAHWLAWKNGLRLSDLLQGLQSTATNDTTPLAPFRSINRSLILNWSDLALNFSESIRTVENKEAAQQLATAAKLQPSDGHLDQELELLEDQIDNLLSEEDASSSIDEESDYERRAAKLEQVTKDAFQLTSPLNIPWLMRYRQTADTCTNGLGYDQFENPAVILSVCTTTENSNPIETLRSLQLLLPKQFRNGLYDPNSVRHEVLVLHDSMVGPKAWDETALRGQLVQVFGPASSILRINSLSPETAQKLAEEEQTDLWGGGGKLGTCLSVSDKARIRKYLVHLVTTAVLPALERRINDLNIVVSERKKGVRNVLKSFWGGRKKEDEEPSEVSSSLLYRYDSVESQTRLLADTLFLIRDYDSAYSVYKLIKDDFKQDKSWNHYAAVHEMIALSLYLSDPYGRAKEIFSSIETALLSYSRAAEESPSWGEKPGRITVAPASTRLATRLCLVLIATRNICSGRHLEVADLLASASSHENSLGAAVLLEQSSAHYFKASMFRKYAFHMIMSGHMFRAGGQEHHAFRCFASALHIYRYGNWAELHSHVRSALAAQLFGMGRMSIALQLYAMLLGTMDLGRVSIKSQQKFVQNLLEICNQHKKKALAGADRMAASPKLSGSERDAVRKERQDRIVQVVRFTKSASRVLELPNMGVPRVDDTSVAVIAGEAAHYLQESVACFGDASVGSDEVWNELTIATVAELKACSSILKSDDEMIIGKTLEKIEDPDCRRVIALIEKERSKMERSKKASSLTSSAPIRALKEPIAVEFKVTNPLGIAVELCDLQLVAKMKAGDDGRICTNEDAISIRVLAESNEKPSWTFQGSDAEFYAAEFCRVSVSSNEETGGWKSAEEVEPFFVVTKDTVSLQEESSRTISASICPLTEGYLEVVGVRCRLFNEIWVFHPFDVKGPLLQDTRSNRANRVRGESFLLKSKVERGMPRLAVDLVQTSASNSDGPVLESQIGQWALRFSNMGTAPASNITVKTNVPWLNMKQNETTDPDEERPISCCVGPTGTLMAVPIKGLSVDSEIQPGETVDVPVEIKASGTGKREFYMLFRYSLPGETGESRCRWLRKMFSVPVYPSLNVSASVMPSFSTPQEYILSLEMSNCRNDRPDLLDLELENVTLVSRNYMLKPIKGQTTSSPVSLGWQERMVFHFKVICKDEGDLALLLTQCSFAGSSDPTIASDLYLLDSLCLQRAHDDFEETVRQHHMALARAAATGHDDAHPRSISSIRRANTAASSIMDDVDLDEHCHSPTSVTRLCPKPGSLDSIHIICSWRDQVGSVVGTHHIRGLPVRPTGSSQTGCPIVLTASHPTEITNDFSCGPATVPLHVTLRNTLVDDDVEFEFKVEAPDYFDFTGPQLYRSSLKSGAQTTLPMRAILPNAGVYNLQKIKLRIEDGDSISYSFPFQWMVTASSSD